MKRSVAKKIESLLAASESEPKEEQKEKPKKSGIMVNAERIGKFCRQLPVTLFNLIRPAPRLDLHQDGKV